MRNFALLCLFSAVIVTGAAKSEENGIPPLKGTKWNLEVQFAEREFKAGEFNFAKIEKEKIEADCKVPGQEGAGTFKGTLKDGLLKGKISQNKENWEIEVAITMTGKGDYITPGLGRWRKVGDKDWTQCNLTLPGRSWKVKPQERLAPKDLATGILREKGFILSDGRKDSSESLGSLVVKKVNGIFLLCDFTSAKGVTREVKGALLGTNMGVALAKPGRPNFLAVFYQEEKGGKKVWKAKVLFGEKDDPLKAMVTLTENGEEKKKD